MDGPSVRLPADNSSSRLMGRSPTTRSPDFTDKPPLGPTPAAEMPADVTPDVMPDVMPDEIARVGPRLTAGAISAPGEVTPEMAVVGPRFTAGAINAPAEGAAKLVDLKVVDGAMPASKVEPPT